MAFNRRAARRAAARGRSTETLGSRVFMLSRSLVRLWSAVTLISAYGIFCGRSAYVFNSLVWGFEGFVFLAAAAGLALRARWSAYLVFILALVLCGFWVHSVWLVVDSGYFDGVSVSRRVLSLIPGLLMVALAGYCCVVAAVETSVPPKRT
jgi:hypothetical protein